MLSDIEIAQKAQLKPINEVAESAGIPLSFLEHYGSYKAKVRLDLLKELESRPNGKLILVTAMTATPAGDGKTCTAVGLAQAFGKLNDKVMLCLREPSLGPTFGMKGGATGGGYSQVIPMEDINLHFTGDIHAVGTAHNLLAAMVDNHISRGNSLNIDPLSITWKRVVDMNDRALRQIVIGLGGKSKGGVPRESGFEITVASEVMAILALSSGIEDLKKRLSSIVVGYNRHGQAVTAGSLKAQGAMALLLKDAIKPNLVQTLEGQPAFVHCGPFGNIAHGTNSILATRMALKLADYVVTEAGFATDLGAEKFCHIVCRAGGFTPSAAVLVVTLRAIHMHGGAAKGHYEEKNLEALKQGMANVDKHAENLFKFGITPIVAINKFPSDDPEEIEYVKSYCQARKIQVEISNVVMEGGQGGMELACRVKSVVDADHSRFRPIYAPDEAIKEKIRKVAREIYGADDVEYQPKAEKDIESIVANGFDKLPLCIAKTQYSLSDDPNKLNRPTEWKLNVRELRPSVGAGFIVVYTGEVMTMPGLPEHPAAESIDIDESGIITGLS
jgi:formate--tetrahydrofolate ligase